MAVVQLNKQQQSALQDFGRELEQFQQQFQSKCYNVAQQLDPQSANIISKNYDPQSSVRSEASHAGRAGSSISGSPVEQLQAMTLAIQEDLSQVTNWVRQSIESS